MERRKKYPRSDNNIGFQTQKKSTRQLLLHSGFDWQSPIEIAATDTFFTPSVIVRRRAMIVKCSLCSFSFWLTIPTVYHYINKKISLFIKIKYNSNKSWFWQCAHLLSFPFSLFIPSPGTPAHPKLNRLPSEPEAALFWFRLPKREGLIPNATAMDWMKGDFLPSCLVQVDCQCESDCWGSI